MGWKFWKKSRGWGHDMGPDGERMRELQQGQHGHVRGRSAAHRPFGAREHQPDRRPIFGDAALQRPKSAKPINGVRRKFARFQTDPVQQRGAAPAPGPLARRPSMAPRTKYPFTVPGKGRQNVAAPSGRRASVGGNRNDIIGKDIMRKYNAVKKLKKGGMAMSVTVVRQKATNTLYVEKSIPLRNSRENKRARAEIHTLVKINEHGRHQNLNAIIEYEINEARGKCSIILEYCDLGSIEDVITGLRRSRKIADESVVWNVVAGVASGLAFMHHGLVNGRPVSPSWNTICHLDLKPCNIFRSSRGGKHGHSRIVLADFGCAISQSDVARRFENPYARQECGTPAWYPPEGRKNGVTLTPYWGPKTDIWQLGATAHVLCNLLGSQGPNRQYLASARPCSSRYCDRLNGIVQLFCHPQAKIRPMASEIVREAAYAFEQTARTNQGWH